MSRRVLLFCEFPSREEAERFVAFYESRRRAPVEERSIEARARKGWTAERRAKVTAAWATKREEKARANP